MSYLFVNILYVFFNNLEINIIRQDHRNIFRRTFWWNSKCLKMSSRKFYFFLYHCLFIQTKADLRKVDFVLVPEGHRIVIPVLCETREISVLGNGEIPTLIVRCLQFMGPADFTLESRFKGLWSSTSEEDFIFIIEVLRTNNIYMRMMLFIWVSYSWLSNASQIPMEDEHFKQLTQMLLYIPIRCALEWIIISIVIPYHKPAQCTYIH